MTIKTKIKLSIVIALILIIECSAKVINKATIDGNNCDDAIARLKRSANDALMDDDNAFIETLIRNGLNDEKQKCIDRYNLQETHKQPNEPDDAKELRREVSKLKDLVKVIKDQRYILNILNNSAKETQNDVNIHKSKQQIHLEDEQDADEKAIQNLQKELFKLKQQIQNTKKTDHEDDIENALDHPVNNFDRKQFHMPDNHNAEIKTKLDKQGADIENLKRLLQGVLQEIKLTNSGTTTTTTTERHLKQDDNIAEMLNELAQIEKKLSNISYHESTKSPLKPSGNAKITEKPKIEEVVGSPMMKSPAKVLQKMLHPGFSETLPHQEAIRSGPRLNGIVANFSPQLKSRSAGSGSGVTRASEDDLRTLLNLIAPEKSSSSSIDALLKSLDLESADSDVEQRLLNVEKQMKRRKQQQLEQKLKNLEKQLTHDSGAIQSKSGDDADGSTTSELKRLLVKIITDKKKVESKSLDDDVILDELKELQKSIKSMSTDDGNSLFGDIEEKNDSANGNSDISLNQLISAGGAGGGGGGHRKRKLTSGQIQAIRKRIMAMQNGAGGVGGGGGGGGFGSDGYGEGSEANSENEYGNYGGVHGGAHGYHDPAAYSGEAESTYDFNGPTYGGPGHHQNYAHRGHGSGSYGGPSYGSGYGPFKYGTKSGSNNAYGRDGNAKYPEFNYPMVVPTNQFGTPLYPSGIYSNFPNGYPLYSSAPYANGPQLNPNYNMANTGSSVYGPSKYGTQSAPASGYAGAGNGYSGVAPSSNYPGAGTYPSGIYKGNVNLTPYQINSTPGQSYQGSSQQPGLNTGYSNENRKQFFPASGENSGTSYQPQSNPGVSSQSQSYQNQPTAYENPNAGPPNSVADLKNQIYDLQGVINNFNRPEYIQKPEDKEIVYNLDKQIKDLKSVINNLQEPVYQDQGSYDQSVQPQIPQLPQPPPPPPQAPQSQSQVSAPTNQYVAPVAAQPNPAPPPLPIANKDYAAPRERSFRRYRRDLVERGNEIGKHDEALQTLAELLTHALGMITTNQSEEEEEEEDDAQQVPPKGRVAMPKIANVFDDVNQRIADVRKQAPQVVTATE